MNFMSPTPIQAASLPVALADKDVVGVAQTVRTTLFYGLSSRLCSQGSGKTLAYGLPILHYLLSQPRPAPGKRRHVRALFLAPTRELALQVSSHLNACLNPVESNEAESELARKGGDRRGNKGKGKAKPESRDVAKKTASRKGPPHVSVAAIVGGMSTQKQRRILDRGVDILVATPGRLWDIMEEVRFLSFPHSRSS